MHYDNNLSCISVDEGAPPAYSPSPSCTGPEGGASISPAPAVGMVRVFGELDSTPQADGADFTLSAEERRMIAMVAAGCTNKEMARHFALSESTIYRRTVRIFGKVGAANKFELLLIATFSRISVGAEPEKLG